MVEPPSKESSTVCSRQGFFIGVISPSMSVRVRFNGVDDKKAWECMEPVVPTVTSVHTGKSFACVPILLT